MTSVVLPNERVLPVVLARPTGRDALVGRTWEDAGGRKPENFVLCDNELLASAVNARGGATATFTADELRELDAGALSPQSFVKVGGRHIVPVAPGWDSRLARDDDAERDILRLKIVTLRKHTLLHNCHKGPQNVACCDQECRKGPGTVLLKLCVGGGKSSFPENMGTDGVLRTCHVLHCSLSLSGIAARALLPRASLPAFALPAARTRHRTDICG